MHPLGPDTRGRVSCAQTPPLAPIGAQENAYGSPKWETAKKIS